MDFNDIQIIILFSSIVLFTTLGVAIALFYIFQKKKIAYIIKQQEQEKDFQRMIIRSRIEIKEHTLKNIAWELHDNIGQLLSLAKMQLNYLVTQNSDNKEDIKEISDVIGISLDEIRAMSKTLNSDVISSIGLEKAINIEAKRLNKLQFIETKFEVLGDYFDIPNTDQIILFRIVQEVLSNTIKHSKATTLFITMDYHPGKLIISLKDNGVGFDAKKIEKGSGLINMKGRAELINSKLIVNSGEKGTTVSLIYPSKNEKK